MNYLSPLGRVRKEMTIDSPDSPLHNTLARVHYKMPCLLKPVRTSNIRSSRCGKGYPSLGMLRPLLLSSRHKCGKHLQEKQTFVDNSFGVKYLLKIPKNSPSCSWFSISSSISFMKDSNFFSVSDVS